jgi:hypothetical protein
MRASGWIALVLALGLGGCGGDDDGDGGGQHTLACDINAGTDSHACLEFNWTGPEAAADAYDDQCEQGGATTVSVCPSAGKVGGCRYTTTSGSVTVTWTNWFYFGTASELMQACMSSGGLTATWVNP